MAGAEDSPRVETDSGAEVKDGLTYLNGVITVVERADDFMAYVGGDTRVWGCGRNPDEAVGSVVRAHPEYIVAALESSESLAQE